MSLIEVMENATQRKRSNRIESLTPLKRGLLLTVVVLTFSIIFLVIAEISVRSRMYLKHGSFWGFEVRHWDREVAMRVPRPGIKRGTIEINSQGFRSPEVEEKQDGTVRIAFLGGSTTFSAEVSANHLTWPSVVVDKLGDEYLQTHIDYINAGVVAYNTTNSYWNLVKRVAKYDSDIIFIYHGINDIALDGYFGAVKQGVIRPEEMTSDAIPNGIRQKSLLVDLLYKNLLIHFQRQQTETRSWLIDYNEDLTTERFRYRLKKLVDAAREASELVILPTFTNRLRDGLTPEQIHGAMETHAIYIPFYTSEDLLKALLAYNDVIREFADTDGVLVLDTETAIASSPDNFVDSVHFTDTGSQRFGAHIAAELLTSTQFQEVISSKTN